MLKINHGKKYVQDQQKQIMKDHITSVKVHTIITQLVYTTKVRVLAAFILRSLVLTVTTNVYGVTSKFLGLRS
jgi:hypothetical protein